jgi:hypothetical protein
VSGKIPTVGREDTPTEPSALSFALTTVSD